MFRQLWLRSKRDRDFSGTFAPPTIIPSPQPGPQCCAQLCAARPGGPRLSEMVGMAMGPIYAARRDHRSEIGSRQDPRDTATDTCNHTCDVQRSWASDEQVCSPRFIVMISTRASTLRAHTSLRPAQLPQCNTRDGAALRGWRTALLRQRLLHTKSRRQHRAWW